MSDKVLVPRWLLLIIIVISSTLLVSFIFFMVTIRYSQPVAMKLYVPKGSDPAGKALEYKGDSVLTILLGKNDVVGYYQGELTTSATNLVLSDYTNIRKVIVDRRRIIGEKKFVVVIKPSGAASYKNTVDMLDEMTIDDVKKYSMVDISPPEDKLVNQ